MAKVITYSNSALTCYSTIQLDSEEKVFISIASMPKPSIVIYKSRLLGLANSASWEFNPQMSGGYEAYVRKLMRAFTNSGQKPQHLLDDIKDLLMICGSVAEVIGKLFAAERHMNTPLPQE